MAAEIITKEDLKEFKNELLADMESIFGKRSEEPKKWIKSYQVRNMLKISENTLTKLREDGTINSTKIGGIHYYNYDEIVRTLEGKAK